MKRRLTMSMAKLFTKKSIFVMAAILMFMAIPLSLVQNASADKFDDQIRALQQQVDQAQSQADQLRRQADTLANKLSELAVQKASIQSQIDISQANYDKLQQEIADSEQKIKDNQAALGTTIANLYVDDAISPLEMLASSKNIGDYVDKQTLRSSIQDTLTKTIGVIKALKSKLEQDKLAVQAVIDKQTAQKNSLIAVAQQQQVILDQTKGQEAAYQTQAASAKSQLENVSQQQRAYYQSLIRQGIGGASSGVSGSFQYFNLTPSDGGSGCGGGGYPYCGSQDSYSDPWGLYNRECVSYVAWALSARFHRYVGNFSGAGNAYQWPSTAPSNSGAVRVPLPQPGDAVILPQSGGFAPLGHAMIVESVNGDMVHVSQYNFYGSGAYSSMDIKTSGVIFLRFPSA